MEMGDGEKEQPWVRRKAVGGNTRDKNVVEEGVNFYLQRLWPALVLGFKLYINTQTGPSRGLVGCAPPVGMGLQMNINTGVSQPGPWPKLDSK